MRGTFYLGSGKNYDITAPIGKIRSLCKVELPFHQYNPEFAFIMELPELREEIRPLGLDIGLPFIPDAVLYPEGNFINKYNRNSVDFSLERYLSSSSRLLPGYATRFNSVNHNDLLGYITSGEYIFKNEYVERMQYLAMTKNLYSATLEQMGKLRATVFFAVNSRSQLQYINRCYHKDVNEYQKLMLNLCILSTFEFCRQHKYACNISQTVNFMNIDSRFGYDYGSYLWEFNTEYYPAICGNMNFL